MSSGNWKSLFSIKQIIKVNWPMSTKNMEVPSNVSCLIIGYFRFHEKEHSIIVPKGIATICINFYYIASKQSPAERRLIRDFLHLSKNPSDNITAAPMDENNLMEWEALIFGADNTEMEGGIFKLQLSFSDKYPNRGPKVKFITKMFHPNIYENGQTCLDWYRDWSPIYTVQIVLESLKNLLNDPNPKCPCNSKAADLYINNRTEYDKQVRNIVEQSWEDYDTDTESDDEGDSQDTD
eukprot:515657_1